MEKPTPLRFADLFCGIGGFRIAAERAAQARGHATHGVFACDIDAQCRRAYAGNFGDEPAADITEVAADDVPEHDLLLAGFPCQPFSIIGERRGFEDARGTLFFDIARILEARRPPLCVLENVKQLRSHHGGRTLRRIMETLAGLGYAASWRTFDARDFGLPQRRERVWIVGFQDADASARFRWPAGDAPMRPLADLLEPEEDVPAKFQASEHIRRRRVVRVRESVRTQPPRDPVATPMIWHENKSGAVSVHPYACALRAGASHNYLLVNGRRRPTTRELLRLQGFPDTHRIVCSDYQTRRQAGNSLPVPVAEAVIGAALDALSARPHAPIAPSAEFLL